MSVKQKDIVLHYKNVVFPHKVSHIRILETHISWIFLTGKYAYKLKKNVKFGKVLDFSSLKLRKKFCQREVIINTILCGRMYQGVVKIVKAGNKYKIVNLIEAGKPLEFAVKMLEIPQKFRMDNLVDLNKVSYDTLDIMIDTLVKFHNLARTNATIIDFGKPRFMKSKIRENFRTLSYLTKIDTIFEDKLILFIKENSRLFHQRIKETRIRDIHGDLYLKNIFFLDGKFYMYDRIEFNDSLRYADVAEDVAHLAMDLHYHRREDLQRYLISNYIRKSNDTSLMNLIYFMMCYKSCVRAKVSIFRASQLHNTKQKLKYISEANHHFKLATKYLELF
jgi:aminoglycoside phosphotransferase family enzyme